MSCRTTAAGSAVTTYARLESGLTDIQTLSAYHALRADGRGTPAPAAAEWESYVTVVQASVRDNEDLSEARRRSILARLDRARSEVPDGASWYALLHMQRTAERQAVAIESQLREASSELGLEMSEIRGRYTSYMNEVDRNRSSSRPEGYSDATRASLRDSDLPQDHGSYSALRRLQDEVAAHRADRGNQRRIELAPMRVNSRLARAGYDPEDGRLEVTFARRDGESRIYAYRGVPAETWSELQRSRTPASYYNEHIRGRSEYRYESQAAEEAGAGVRRCGGCGQFAGAGHVCPARAAQVPGTPVSAAPVEVEVPVEAPSAQVFEKPVAADPDPVVETPPAPEPEPAPEPVVETTERPVRTARSLGLYNRRRRRSRQDMVRSSTTIMPPVTELRAAAVNGPVEFEGQWQSYWRSSEFEADSVEATSAIGWQLAEGTVTVDRPGRGQYEVSVRNVRCSCRMYREHGDCPHVRGFRAHYEQAIVPSTSTRSTEVDTAAIAAAAEQAVAMDWTRSEATAQEARSRWAASEDGVLYSNDFGAFETAHSEALARKSAGESPVPYMTENASNGLLTRESGRGFGVELEFDFPSTMDASQKAQALQAIGNELHARGLTSTAQQQHYGSSRARGYTENHQGGWSFERDCTVSGEIVSPVMYDEPETWQALSTVCAIVKQHGGVASTRTGSHVHVGSANTTGAAVTELARMVNQHEDVMYRISQNPDRNTHRPMRWCGPNRDVPQGGYADATEGRRYHNGHHQSLNLQSVTGGPSDHVEIRHWDGTLDPGVIQTQAKISAGLVAAAERNGQAGTAGTIRPREIVGAHKARLEAVRGRSRRALTSDELREDSATARSFFDTLFNRKEDKAQAASLFAVTNWQKHV